MLFDPTRHEALQLLPWDETRVRAFIQHIVADTEARFSPDRYWPTHPRDLDAGDDPAQRCTPLYHGACGVIWALHYLQDVGAARLSRRYDDALDTLLMRNRAWLGETAEREQASYLMGDTPILLLAQGQHPSTERAERVAALIEGNREHPARELMWGSPGTLLAALFLHQRSGEARWAELFQRTAATLWSQLEWSAEHACHYWTQDLYGQRVNYIDAVHGFVGTASALIRGRHLLGAETWAAWEQCIVNTVQRTATWEGAQANWRPWLDATPGKPLRMLMQHCHGAGLRRLSGRPARHRPRRTADRRRRSGVGGRPAHQRLEPVPRHGRQWLRLPQALATHGSADVAGACAGLRDARHRADRGRCRAPWPTALLAVDR